MRTRSLALVAAVGMLAACSDNTLLSTQPQLSSPTRIAASVTAFATRGRKKYLHPLSASAAISMASFASANAATVLPPEPDVTYHGGPLITEQRLVAIYYSPTTIYTNGPRPGTTGPGSRDRSLVGYFMNNVGESDRWNVNTMYYELRGRQKRYVQNQMEYTAFWAAAAGAPNPGDVVSDDDMFSLVEGGFRSGALRYDPTTLYMIFTGPGVNLGGGFAPDNLQYCAWHWAYQRRNGQMVQVSAMPYNADFSFAHPSNDGYVCTVLENRGPNGDFGADAIVDGVVHETEETATDPFITDDSGWWDENGWETSDKCAYHYGTVKSNGLDIWNLKVGGKPFLAQQQWALTKPQGCLTGLSQNQQQIAVK